VQVVEQLATLAALVFAETLEQALCFPVRHGAGDYAGRRPPAYGESPNT
jgi:hypothetical protein